MTDMQPCWQVREPGPAPPPPRVHPLEALPEWKFPGSPPGLAQQHTRPTLGACTRKGWLCPRWRLELLGHGYHMASVSVGFVSFWMEKDHGPCGSAGEVAGRLPASRRRPVCSTYELPVTPMCPPEASLGQRRKPEEDGVCCAFPVGWSWRAGAGKPSSHCMESPGAHMCSTRTRAPFIGAAGLKQLFSGR